MFKQLTHLKSLKSRLALWVFLPTLLISIVDLITTYKSADNIATLVQEQLLKGAVRIISERLTVTDNAYEITIPPAAFELFANPYKDRVFYSVRSQHGLLIAGNQELPAYQAPLQIEQEKYFLTTIRGEPVRVIAYAHALPNKSYTDYAITQVAQTLRSHDAFQRELFFLIMREHLLLLSIIVVALIIAFRWTLKPLMQFGEKLLARQPGSLEKLDERHAPNELRPVIFALNDYAARLDKSLSSYGQFVANTAHQLRTSFAIVTSQINFANRSGELNAEQKEVINAMQKTVLQGTKVINQLLMLATIEQHHSSLKSLPAVELADIIKSVIEELAPLAHQKNIDLGIDTLDEPSILHAPTQLLRELVSNLIDNAIQHIDEGGVITVSLLREQASLTLSVADNGPGIPLDERQKVFARFYRLNENKANSSGLGLAIVKEICDTLNATISLDFAENDRGLLVQVRFPN